MRTIREHSGFARRLLVGLLAAALLGACGSFFDDDDDDYSSDSSTSITLKTTSSTYSPSDDWNAKVRSDLGSSYEVADWQDLKDYYAAHGLSELKSLLSSAGLYGYSSDGGAFVTYNGSKSYSSDRFYFAARFDGSVPSTFLAHQNIGSNTLCLGSWSGYRRILAIKTSSSTTTAQNGTITGTLISATTGAGISNVLVSVQGYSSYSDTTDSGGAFSISLPAGSYTLQFYLTGYSFSDATITVSAGASTALPANQAIGNPAVSSGAMRIVLSWGQNPSDLDAHLLSPAGGHLYFSNKAISGAVLDVDDTTSYGPETVTISSFSSGTYKYYVHRFSGSGTLATSGAVVKVYDSGGLLRTISVPTSGTGDYWYVGTFTGSSAFTSVNTIQATAP